MSDNEHLIDPTPKQLVTRLDGQAAAISRLIADVSALANRVQEPGPYQELAAEVTRLSDGLDLQRRIVASLEGFADRATVPTITVRHWPEADGTWGYETTVTITPATLNALTETLAYTDAAARQEARRRADEDARAKQQSSSSGRGY